ncbi:MAG: sulfatase [Planctomycetaceae bacterium]|nr:sulfatase [Planctomycetaceae bacterium]
MRYAFALITLLLSILPTSLQAEKPNFVLIFIDDMGYGDIGPYGSEVNETPNLDRMAAEGMKLTSFYAAPVCSASRAQLMTGSYAPRVSVPGVFFPAGPKGLHPDELTIADYLKEAGYATTCIGKWHLGDQREFLPTRQGFDHYFGIPYSNDMARKSATDGRAVHPLMRDEEVAAEIENEDQRQITRQYTQEAVKFIEESKDEPFFLYLPHTAMHVPIYPHPDFVGSSDNGRYGDWIREVDWSVGEILDTLRKHKLEENTLVVFTSDNGPWASKGKDGGVATPLRGSKGGTLEGGVREPTIAWWPGTIEAGTANDCIAGTPDVLPTFVSLAGGQLNPDVKIDGYDLSPVLTGKAERTERDAWYYYKGTKLMAVRSGPWKLALAPQSIGMGFREQPEDIRSDLRLYNLDTDIGETFDVAQENPEVVARLQKLANEMIADIGSGKPGPGVRPPGTVENPVTLFPSVSNRRRNKPSGKPVNWKNVKIGDVYASGSAPAIAGKPFIIEAVIEGEKQEGVIVSHGGSAVGYSLYAKEGKIVFAMRVSNDEVRRVSIPWENPERPIRAEVTKNGVMKLMKSLSEREETGTISAAGKIIESHPQEDLSVGFDERNPVDPESPKGKFNGKIKSLKVEVEKE